jgi:hypothetical protein
MNVNGELSEGDGGGEEDGEHFVCAHEDSTVKPTKH